MMAPLRIALSFLSRANRSGYAVYAAALGCRAIVIVMAVLRFLVLPHDSTLADNLAAPGGATNPEFIQQIWTRQHGLPDNAVQAILQTRDGFLWLGTRAGLARFDGREFKVFNHLDSDAFVSDDCLALAEDRDGTLWIGTTSGLIHFVRGRCTRYSVQDGLLHDRVTKLCVSRTGDLWIGTYQGISRRRNGQIATLLPPRPKSSDDDAQILALHEDRAGTVWVSDMWGLRRCEAGRDQMQEVPTPIDGHHPLPNGFAEDREGALWAFSTRVVRFLNGVWRVYDHGPFGLEQTSRALVADHEGMLWGGTGRGVVRFADGVVTSRFTRNDGLSNDQVLSLFADRRGHLWIGTENGLNCWRRRHIKVLTAADGLATNNVRALSLSKSGGVWVGTDGGVGLAIEGKQSAGPNGSTTSPALLRQSVPTSITGYTDRHGVTKNTIRALREDRLGRLWIGSELGLDCLEKGKGIRFDVLGQEYERAVRVIYDDRFGAVWFGSQHGLHCWKDGGLTKSLFREFLAGAEPRVFHEDRQGNLWIGTRGDGLFRWSGLEAFASSGTSESGRPLTTTKPEWIKFTTQGWSENVGQASSLPVHGASSPRVSGGRMPPELAGTMSAPQAQSESQKGLCDDYVTVLHEDSEGTIWIGTQGGLNRLKDGRLAAIRKANGLPGQIINQILEDDFGHLWIGSDQGILRARKKDLDDVMEGRKKRLRCVVYDETDGMLSRETNGGKSQPSGLKTLDGRLWFATPAGIVVIDPKELITDTEGPSVVIEQVRATGKTVYVQGAGEKSQVHSPKSQVQSPKHEVENRQSGSERQAGSLSARESELANHESEIVLAPGSGRVLDIQFTAPYFTAAERIRFRYRLDGFDTDWVEAGTTRAAYYTNLRPGRYQFHVMAANHNNVWGDVSATMAFHVAPHFYQTWAFRLTGGGASFLFIYAFYRWRLAELRRIQQLEKENALNKERARIAKDLHDDLGANLTKMSLLVELTQRDLSKPESAEDHLRKLAISTKQFVRTLKEIIWSSNPDCDTLENLCAHLCKFAGDFLGPAGIACRFQLPEELPDHSVAVELRQQLFLVVKEAVHNVVKHARASEVWLRFASTNGTLLICVEDNGRGFCESAAASEGGHGLVNMRQRVEHLGGRFEIDSRPGNGTKVSVTISLKPLAKCY